MVDKRASVIASTRQQSRNLKLVTVPQAVVQSLAPSPKPKMSVFSKIVRSKKAASAHKQEEQQKEKNVPAKVPYKHVPTHAAIDALSGAPSTWKVEDRSKIREHHKRRSQMASRTHSTLSTVSYLNSNAGPSSAGPSLLPRNNSYNSYNPAWFDRGGEVYQEPAQKKPRQSRSHFSHDSGIGPSVRPSPLASNMHSEDVSPVMSSGNSSTSDSSDNLEISFAQPAHVLPRPQSMHVNSFNSNHSNQSNRMSRPQPVVYGEKDVFSRLHTSTTRKLGEAPLYDRPPVVIKAPAATVTTVEQKPKKQRWSILAKRNNAITVS